MKLKNYTKEGQKLPLFWNRTLSNIWDRTFYSNLHHSICIYFQDWKSDGQSGLGIQDYRRHSYHPWTYRLVYWSTEIRYG